MSITSFAPGAVVVKDGAEHLCVGFAAYQLSGARATPRAPLAVGVTVSRCTGCGALDTLPDTTATQCAICQHQPLLHYDVHQPEGYRTIYSQPDFDDSHYTPAHRGYVELSASTRHAETHREGSLTYSLLEQTPVVAVNDNQQHLFRLHKAGDGTVIATNRDLYRNALPDFLRNTTPAGDAAIGEIKRTDVLLLSPTGVLLPTGTVPTSAVDCPAGRPALTSYAEVLRRAAKTQPRRLVWGRQVDVRIVRPGQRTDDPTGALTAGQVAGYLAKYATKDAGDLTRTETRRPHVEVMQQVCRQLADRAYAADGIASPYALLGRWVHMLGFRGHFSTKSRRYSITLGALRRARARWQALAAQCRRTGEPIDLADLEARLLADDEQETTLVVGHWVYVGSGWQTAGDEALALAAAARAREYAQHRAEERKSMKASCGPTARASGSQARQGWSRTSS